jgi:hypothetical protein
MNKINLILFVLTSIIFLNILLVSAEKIDTDLSISIQCTNSTYANLSYAKYILDSRYLIDSEDVMTKNGAYYNYTIDYLLINQTGTLEYGYHCDLNGIDTVAGNKIYISLMGEELTSGQGLLYIVIFIGLLIILGITTYFAIIFPFSNPRSEEDGKILTVTDFKYVKIVLWVFSYLELLFIIMILKNLTGYLLIEGTYSFFRIIYMLMLVALLPFFPLLIFFTIVLWINDKKVQKKLQRGLEVY